MLLATRPHEVVAPCSPIHCSWGSVLSWRPHLRPADSVVKVLVTVRRPNPVRPWAPSKSGEATGSGVVIAGQRILTNAHVVRYATEVRVQGRPGEEKFDARVVAIAHDMDLAI